MQFFSKGSYRLLPSSLITKLNMKKLNYIC